VDAIVSAVADSTYVAPPHDEPFLRCECPRWELRRRKQSNDVIVIVKQCLRCGRNMGNVPKNSTQAARLNWWDEELRRRWRQEQIEFSQRKRADFLRHQAKENADWWRFYNEYLLTEKWKGKCELVRVRCGGICEGCRVRQMVQIHHLTYEHVGDEFLWELVGVCIPCHKRIHPHLEA
jgi:hypothetical protein